MMKLHNYVALGLICLSSVAFAQKKSVKKALPASSQKTLVTQNDSLSYCIGLTFAETLKRQGFTSLDEKDFLQGMQANLKGQKTEFSVEQAVQLLNNYFTQEFQKKGEASLNAGKQFLENNKKKPGVIALVSGLQYEIIKEGNGPKPADTSMVKVHYTGKLLNGKVFDSSVQRGEPIELGVNQVIKGWQEALKLMPVGSKWMLYIPSELAYGERGAGSDIGPNEALIFEVELLEIVE